MHSKLWTARSGRLGCGSITAIFIGLLHFGQTSLTTNVIDIVSSFSPPANTGHSKGSNLVCKGVGALRRRLANEHCARPSSVSIRLYVYVHCNFDAGKNELGHSENQIRTNPSESGQCGWRCQTQRNPRQIRGNPETTEMTRPPPQLVT